MPVSGENYVQTILDHLNGIEIKWTENLAKMLSAIRMLEALRDDIIAHKAPEGTDAAEIDEHVGHLPKDM